MVIRPSDIKKPELSKSLELKIDNHLKGGHTTYDLHGIDYEIIQIIKEKYKNAEWKVKHVFDQRDGDYLEFKE